jgi:hypothetical protein
VKDATMIRKLQNARIVVKAKNLMEMIVSILKSQIRVRKEYKIVRYAMDYLIDAMNVMMGIRQTGESNAKESEIYN